MNAEPYFRKLDRTLDRMGRIYTWRDIEERLADGRMQSFSHGNSVLVTQMNVFPRATTLDWIIAVGDIQDYDPIQADATAFAERNNIALMRSYGRRGWGPRLEGHGWKRLTVNQVYQREL